MNANDLLKNLTAPELNNPNFTNSFSQLISDINTNFKLLASAPFGVGGQGDSIVSYMEYLFVKSDDNTLLTNIGYEVFKVLFPKIDWTNVNIVTERDYEVIKGIINITYPPINNIGVLNMFDVKLDVSPNGNVCEWAWCGTELIDGTHQSILPISLYQFYDQRTSGLSSVNNTSFEDMTASVFATLDESGSNIIYKSLSIYPKLYFDRSNNYWAWMINNEKTGINATGPQGNPGSAGSALLYNYNTSTETGYYFYEGAERDEQYMTNNGILKEGSIRFRVVNEEVPEQGDPIRSELYLDAYSIIDGAGAWDPNMSVQLYKTLDNWLIKNYFDEIHARVVQPSSPQTLRVLGLPIFSSYDIDESSKIGYPTVGSTITGYHSIEPRREKIGSNERNKLLIQPIVATDLFNKLGVPNANTTIPNCDMQILDYVNIYINKANDPIFANIKNDSFSILNSALPNKYTKQTIDGIEVLNNNIRSNLSGSNLLIQYVGGYEDNIIQSNLSHNGLFVESGLKSSIYRADRIQMMNEDNTLLPSTYNNISSNLLYIGTQRVDGGSFVPNITSKGFYVTGNTDVTTEGGKYRTVLYENSRRGVNVVSVTKKSNTSTVDSIQIKEEKPGSTKTNTIDLNSNIIKNGTNTTEITTDKIKITNSIRDVIGDGIHTNEITVNKIKMQSHVPIPVGDDEYESVTTNAEINPYGGMLVPIGGIIMWTHSINNIQTSWRNEIPKGFIPCGSIDNIATFHNNNVAPYCEKLEDIDDQPKYVYTRDLAAQSTSATVIIRPIAAINPTLSGVYYKFNGRLVPGFPIPSYPVKLVGDTNNYDTFIYIMRVF